MPISLTPDKPMAEMAARVAEALGFLEHFPEEADLERIRAGERICDILNYALESGKLYGATAKDDMDLQEDFRKLYEEVRSVTENDTESVIKLDDLIKSISLDSREKNVRATLSTILLRESVDREKIGVCRQFFLKLAVSLGL